MSSAPVEENASSPIGRSLSSRLLAFTAMVVLFTELVILIPSISSERIYWIRERIEAAYLVGLALDAPGGRMIDQSTADQLLATANILNVTLDNGSTRTPILGPKLAGDQLRIAHSIDLDDMMPLSMITDAWATMLSSGNATIQVIGAAKYGEGARVDILLSQAALRSDLQKYAGRVLLLSLLISTMTALAVYWILCNSIVRPIARLTENMRAFQHNPEDRLNLLIASDRLDEIGVAERGLVALEKRIIQLLAERRRLAALGSGISKISHDLRNILASAQLMSDRLSASDDPRVRKLAPRLIASLDRAIVLSRDTLHYANVDSTKLSLAEVKLRELVDEVFDDAAALWVEFENAIPESVTIKADATQLYRALFNLVRNAVEALSDPEFGNGDPSAEPPVIRGKVRVECSPANDAFEVFVIDTGPGIPAAAQTHLFTPFQGSFKPGGSGLGLAIAHEIAIAHGGDLILAQTDNTGTRLKLVLPGALYSTTSPVRQTPSLRASAPPA